MLFSHKLAHSNHFKVLKFSTMIITLTQVLTNCGSIGYRVMLCGSIAGDTTKW